jgi:hypothetical protein
MVEKAITARQSDPGLGTFQTTVENNTFVWTGEDSTTEQVIPHNEFWGDHGHKYGVENR